MNSSFTLRDRLFFIIWIVYYFYMMLNSIAFAKGSLIAVAMHAVLLIYLCYYNFIRNDLSNKFFFIYVYLIGLAILIILSSSNMFYSFRNLIKFSEELLCLSVGFALFRNRDNIDRMLWLLKMMVYMFILMSCLHIQAKVRKIDVKLAIFCYLNIHKHQSVQME